MTVAKTYMAKPSDVEPRWWLFDAEDKIVGHIDICFLCSNYSAAPSGFARSWDFEALRDLVADLGMPKANPAWDNRVSE